jgi:thiol-disulfide isomerase/thioredoxin
MKKSKKWVMIISFLFAAVLASAVVAFGAESVTILGNTVQAAPADCANAPIIELPIPGSEGEKSYLGLSGIGNFKIGQIKSQILIIEIFSFYCPHCQRMASQVNDLYQEIQKRSDLNGKIKMIGIGAKNSAYEVDSFRERYHVSFPLFPDKDLDITEKLCVKGTPTFIGFKVDGKGFQERFYFGEGGFQDMQKYLSEIIQSAGLK